MWAAGKGGSPLAVRDIYSKECIQLPDATQYDKTVAMRLAKYSKSVLVWSLMFDVG